MRISMPQRRFTGDSILFVASSVIVTVAQRSLTHLVLKRNERRRREKQATRAINDGTPVRQHSNWVQRGYAKYVAANEAVEHALARFVLVRAMRTGLHSTETVGRYYRLACLVTWLARPLTHRLPFTGRRAVKAPFLLAWPLAAISRGTFAVITSGQATVFGGPEKKPLRWVLFGPLLRWREMQVHSKVMKAAKAAEPHMRDGLCWEVHIEESSIDNAAAFPTSEMVVTRGCVQSTNRSELAAVLSHEAGHILCEHTAERLALQLVLVPAVVHHLVTQRHGLLQPRKDYVADDGRRRWLSLGDRRIIDLGMFAEATSKRALWALFRRMCEHEADHVGWHLHKAADFKPGGMASMLSLDEMRQQKGSMSCWYVRLLAPQLETHPATANRIQAMRALDEAAAQ